MTLLHHRPRYVSKTETEIASLFRCKRRRCWHWSLEYSKPRKLYFAVQRDPARIDRFAGVVLLGCLTIHARTRSLVGLGMALEHLALGMDPDGPILVRDDRDVVRWRVYPRNSDPVGATGYRLP